VSKVCASAVLCAAMVLAAGCNKNKSTGEGEGGKKVTIKAPDHVNIKKGETAKLEVTVSREKFDGPVTVSIDKLPDNVSVDGAKEHKLEKANNSHTFTLKAATDAKAATDQNLTVKASAEGVKIEPITVKVNIKTE